jgi:hypothetical protein
MVICPGGGYGHLAPHEGRDYALFLNREGVACFVLKYRLAIHGYRHPAMLDDAARAVRMVRSKAMTWGVDRDRVGIMGSSAGGHLASTLVTHFDAGKPDAADPVERPIMGALCFASKEITPDGLHGYWTAPIPTIFDWVTLESGEAGFQARHGYERDAVVRCSGTGSACILVHRSVFERIGPNPYEPLRNPTTGELIGEDLSFCARAAEHDFPIYVHTGIPTAHLKPIWMGETQHAMWPLS